jgi:transposase
VNQIKHSPKDEIYLFFNRHRDKIKCLSWHKNGFVMFYKRIEEGKFKIEINNAGVVELNVTEMSWLLAGLEWEQMRAWDELDYDKFS